MRIFIELANKIDDMSGWHALAQGRRDGTGISSLDVVLTILLGWPSAIIKRHRSLQDCMCDSAVKTRIASFIVSELHKLLKR